MMSMKPLHVRWIEARDAMRAEMHAKQSECEHKMASIGGAPEQCVHCGLPASELEYLEVTQPLELFQS